MKTKAMVAITLRKHFMNRPPLRNRCIMALFCTVLGTLSLLTSEQPAYAQDKASAKDLVNALHAAFGEHHARAVHTKGVMFEGNFTPDPEAKTLTKEPIFAGDSFLLWRASLISLAFRRCPITTMARRLRASP